MPTVTVSLVGMHEIVARMEQLANHIQYRMLVDVMKKSLEATLAEATGRTPVGLGRHARYETSATGVLNKRRSQGRVAGMLRRSFKIKKMRSENPFLLEVRLMNTAYYAHWVEYGHKIVRKGQVVGHAKPHPFMRPTFESQKGAIIDRVALGIRAGLDKRGV